MLKKPQFITQSMSIRKKLITLLLSVTFFSTIIVGYYGFKKASESYLESALKNAEIQVDQISGNIENFLTRVHHDISFLSKFHATHRFWQWNDLGEKRKTEQWRRTTQDSFFSFIEAKQIYEQIRLIDVSGNEKIRINYNKAKDKAFIVPRNQLQNKSHRPYFKKSSLLKENSLYLTLSRYKF
jgi:hypothetical protein